MGFIWRLCLCQTGLCWLKWSPRPEWKRGGRGSLRGKRDSCWRAHTHTHTHTHTLTQTLTQCPSQSWVVTGPWHWPGMSTMFAKPSITHAPSPPETGTFVWSIYLLSPSFDSAQPNLFPYSEERGFISTYVLFFIFLLLWAAQCKRVGGNMGVLFERRDCEPRFGDTNGPYRRWPGLANKHAVVKSSCM